MPPPPGRSRAQALVLARTIARRARERPELFPRLIEEFSEDSTTRARQGSLGGRRAINLTPWPQVLDALAELRPGEISRVVETEAGFHVLLRSPPPPREVVSGVRLVIGHDRAPFLARLRGGEPVARTRDEARALSSSLSRRARRDPARFAELVARHSDHPDVIRGGDLGQWSTHEPTDLHIHVDVLRRLDVGQVSDPVDTPFGWEVLMRTPNRARQDFALAAIQLHFDPNPSLGRADPASRWSARSSAHRILRLLRDAPDRFEEFQRRACCLGRVQWQEGRGEPALTAALKQLEPGETLVEPVEHGSSFLVVRRVLPESIDPLPTRFELPALSPRFAGPPPQR